MATIGRDPRTKKKGKKRGKKAKRREKREKRGECKKKRQKKSRAIALKKYFFPSLVQSGLGETPGAECPVFRVSY